MQNEKGFLQTNGEQDFIQFLNDYMEERNIKPMTLDEMKEEEGLEEIEASDFIHFQIDSILATAVGCEAEYNGRKIVDFKNDEGNFSVMLKEDEDFEEDEDEDLCIYAGFEYTAYNQDERWLEEAKHNLNNIAW